MNRLFTGIATIALVGVVVAGATVAFYNDTETSTGNVFTAGSVDLKVDHTYAEYNGEVCNNCVEGDTELIVNGGFETPALGNGQWAVYPDGSLTSWDVTGGSAGLEIQNNAAGAPHSGNQLAELDSHTPGDSASGIEQVVDTVPGQQYRLTFYHSPRPNNGPDTDNAIELGVLVTSTSGVMVNDVIGQPSYSGSGTVWKEYTYDFVALDAQTTVSFTDAGSQQDTLGGYLDDISLVTLDCDDTYTYGGTCTLWSETDLSGETFWNFNDVKPGDWGKSIISLHVYGNEAYSCLFPHNIVDDENTRIDPEIEANDTTDAVGELSGELEFFVWGDANANNMYDVSETVYVPAGTSFDQIQQNMIAMPLLPNTPVSLIGFDWCAGTQTGPQNTGDSDPITCSGSGMGDIAQTDKVISEFVAYAEQQRNNDGFNCADVVIPTTPQ